MRRQSESRLSGKQAENPDPQFGHDTQRLFHELQVHQIELELQNEELNQANLAAKAALERFTDLYDFAPVGYFSLDWPFVAHAFSSRCDRPRWISMIQTLPSRRR